MTIENIYSEHCYKEKNRTLDFEDLILKDIDEYFREYDESIIAD